MRKKVFCIIMLVTIISVLIVFIIYFRPQTYKGEYSLSSLNGETINAVFDIKKYKHIFKANTMEGQIIINDIVYDTSIHMGYSSERGEHSYYFSEIKDGYDLNFDNYLYLDFIGKKNKYFRLILIKDGNAEIYYGPVKDKSEVNDIINYQFSYDQ